MNATPASALVIPDSLLAKEATQILREYSTDLLFNHSVRVYLFAAEQGRQQGLRFDAELLYVAAAFHDLGLTKNAGFCERFIPGYKSPNACDLIAASPFPDSE